MERQCEKDNRYRAKTRQDSVLAPFHIRIICQLDNVSNFQLLIFRHAGVYQLHICKNLSCIHVRSEQFCPHAQFDTRHVTFTNLKLTDASTLKGFYRRTDSPLVIWTFSFLSLLAINFWCICNVSCAHTPKGEKLKGRQMHSSPGGLPWQKSATVRPGYDGFNDSGKRRFK